MLKLHKEFHSTPELCWEQQNGEVMTSSWAPDVQIASAAAGEIHQKTAEEWRKSQSQENVHALELLAQNKRNGGGGGGGSQRRSWAVTGANKKAAGSGVRHAGSVRYHGSWQSMEDSYRQAEDGDDDDDDTEEEDDEEEDAEEDAATPVADQVNLLGGNRGDYRAVVKPCRPIYSTSGNCNTLPKRAGSPHCAAPPPNHPPPPPPPPSQVVRIDVDKSHSEYAAATAAAVAAVAANGPERPTTPVMSSFRPSDNAKLYALPQDVKNVGYMTLRPTPSKKMVAPPAAVGGSPPLSSLASRSKSLPPRCARPNVAVKADGQEPRVSVTVNSTPVIPDPDYDSEADVSRKKRLAAMAPVSRVNQIVTQGIGEQQRSKLLIEIQPHHPEQQQRENGGGTLPKSQSFCADILKAKSLLKTSQSFPEELSDYQPEGDDAYVTFVPVNGGGSTDEIRPTGSTLSRHAVSLVQLPPPVENGEADAMAGVEQDSVSTVSTLSSLSTSTNSSEHDATILENHQPVGKKINGHWREMSPASSGAAAGSSDGERTIEESLQLIRKHVDELSGMNSNSGVHRPANKRSTPVVPPPPQFFETVHPAAEADSDPFLAPPPPEFSDSVTHNKTIHHHQQQQQRLLPKSMSSGQLRGSLGDGSDDAVPASFSSHFLNSRRMVERRMSDETINNSKPATVRVVGAVPKKVSFSPDVIEADASRHQAAAAAASSSCRFAHKPLIEWTVNDTADWLDSIFLNEYKGVFVKRNMDGPSLMRVNNETLMNMGVKRLGHRLNMEKSLKYYARDARN